MNFLLFIFVTAFTLVATFEQREESSESIENLLKSDFPITNLGGNKWGFLCFFLNHVPFARLFR